MTRCCATCKGCGGGGWLPVGEWVHLDDGYVRGVGGVGVRFCGAGIVESGAGG